MPGRPDTDREAMVVAEDRAVVKVEKDELQVLFDEKKDALIDIVLAGQNPVAAAGLFRTLVEFTHAKPAQETIVKGGGPMFNVVVSSIGGRDNE